MSLGPGRNNNRHGTHAKFYHDAIPRRRFDEMPLLPRTHRPSSTHQPGSSASACAPGLVSLPFPSEQVQGYLAKDSPSVLAFWVGGFVASHIIRDRAVLGIVHLVRVHVLRLVIIRGQ